MNPCKHPRRSPAGIYSEPCEVPAKWLVRMEGRPPIEICGRHVRTYKGEIAAGFRGTITPLEEVHQCDGKAPAES